MNSDDVTDGQLLAAFATDRADEAFAELVRRHGAMVLGVCRRTACHTQDAEDAAQLTFATLAEKAATLTGSRSVAGWLYNTGWHIGMCARRATLVRRRCELRAAQVDEFEQQEIDADELTFELYRALDLLSPEYRETIVLHHLEGVTVEQVAELMNCNVGTTASRLSRARSQLRERLARRGFLVPAVAIDSILLGATISNEALPQSAIEKIAPVPVMAKEGGVAAADTGTAAAATGMNWATATQGGGASFLSALPPVRAACAFVLLLTGVAGGATAVSALVNTLPSQSERHAWTSWQGTQSSVPEPTSLPLAGVVALLLGRRRSRR